MNLSAIFYFISSVLVIMNCVYTYIHEENTRVLLDLKVSLIKLEMESLLINQVAKARDISVDIKPSPVFNDPYLCGAVALSLFVIGILIFLYCNNDGGGGAGGAGSQLIENISSSSFSDAGSSIVESISSSSSSDAGSSIVESFELTLATVRAEQNVKWLASIAEILSKGVKNSNTLLSQIRDNSLLSVYDITLDINTMIDDIVRHSCILFQKVPLEDVVSAVDKIKDGLG